MMNHQRNDNFDRNDSSSNGTTTRFNKGCGDNDGIWMGIDLGTTHSTCAIWDMQLYRQKSIRLDIAKPIEHSKKRYGKLVPSAVLFVERSFLHELLISIKRQVAQTNTTSTCLKLVDPERIQWMIDHAIIEVDYERVIVARSNKKVDIVALVGQPAFDILELASCSSYAESCSREEAIKDVEEETMAESSNLTSTNGLYDEKKNKSSSKNKDDASPVIINNDNKSSTIWDHLIPSFFRTSCKETSSSSLTNSNDKKEFSSPLFFTTEEVNDALVVSFKRLLGKKKSASGTSHEDQLPSLPYQVVCHDAPTLDNEDANGNDTSNDLYIRVKPLMLHDHTRRRRRRKMKPENMDEDNKNNHTMRKNSDTIDVRQSTPTDDDNDIPDSCLIMDIPPSEVTRICLLALKSSAERSLKSFRNKLHPPTSGVSNNNGNKNIGNVVVGVPANYTRYQRMIVEHAAERCMVMTTKNSGVGGSLNQLVSAGRQESKNNHFVKTLAESTAAIMAYGLFTSSRAHTTTTTTNEHSTDDKMTQEDNDEQRYLTALVFDMGGGTTDVTIASMIRTRSSSAWTYHVLATEGDQALGGDDIDSLLVNWFLSKMSKADAASQLTSHPDLGCSTTTSDTATTTISSRSNKTIAQNRRELSKICCDAKEMLCGDMNKDIYPKESVVVEYDQYVQTLTIDKFNQLIEPILKRCNVVIEKAMTTIREQQKQQKSTMIDEVILVGGGSRIPALRDMIQRKFFSSPNKTTSNQASTESSSSQKASALCTSLNPNAAVAHGCAIYATMESNLIPHHEMMSALMLDALPHSIGILVEEEKDEGVNESSVVNENHGRKQLSFIEVLKKDTALPTSASKTFHLSSMDQKGITVPVVEMVGTTTKVQENNRDGNDHEEEPIYETIGQFSFLLHKLTKQQREHLMKKNQTTRSVDVAISVDIDGKITVSFFDWNDPEHLMKRKRYLRKQQHLGIHKNNDNDEEEEDCMEPNTEEIPSLLSNDQDTWMLLLSCMFLVILYVAVKIMFSTNNDNNPSMNGNEPLKNQNHNEL